MDEWSKVQIRQEVIEELQQLLSGIGQHRGHLILLNDYQVVNLLSVIWASGYASVYGNNPLSVINNGDWLGELWLMLPKQLDCKPNAEPEELARRASEYNRPLNTDVRGARETLSTAISWIPHEQDRTHAREALEVLTSLASWKRP